MTKPVEIDTSTAPRFTSRNRGQPLPASPANVQVRCDRPDAITTSFTNGAEYATTIADAVAETLEESDGDGSDAEEIANRQFEALIEAWGRTA